MRTWRKSIIVSVAIAALVLGTAAIASASNRRAPQYNVDDSIAAVYEYARADGTSVYVNVHQCEKRSVDSAATKSDGSPAIDRHVGLLMIETDANGNVYAETMATMKVNNPLVAPLDRSQIRSYGGGIKNTLVNGEWVPSFVVIDIHLKLTGAGRITTEQQAWTGLVQSTGAGWPMMSVEKRRGGLASGYARIDGASVTGNAKAKRTVSLKTQRETVLPQ